MPKIAEVKYADVPEEKHLRDAEDYLDITIQHSSIIKHAINGYRDVSLKNYLENLLPNTDETYQHRDDLNYIIFHYTKELLGEAVASQAVKDFSKNPIALTANHHGVDYFSHSFQGSLLFSLARCQSGNDLKTVPVFSCANIPLDNATFPQGMLFYLVNSDQMWAIPKKLPVFPNRLRRQLVSSAPSFDEEMIDRAEKRLDKLISEGQISSSLLTASRTVLAEDYRHASVLSQSNYSEQAVMLNNMIWKRLFQKNVHDTQLVFLELEKIVSEVLQHDLKNENSLIWKVMFEKPLREAVLKELDDARACWNLGQLKKRVNYSQLSKSEKKRTNGSGTLFFWGLNESGRRVPLYIVSYGGNKASFMGIDDHDNMWELTYSPENILTALRENRLLPSLFTCFLVLSFARGVRCIGSYFQSEYLPKMQMGLIRALETVPEYQEIIAKVEMVDVNFYLSGMLAVMCCIEDDYLVPAGPLEIIATGGLKCEDIEKILSIKIRDAHLASLLETLPDFVPWMLKSPDWKRRVAQDSLRLLEGNVVIK